MDSNQVHVTIDGKQLDVAQGTKIIDACNLVGIHIPSLCYLKDISSYGSCGVCVVEVEGAKRLVRSCMQSVQNNMVIHTHTQRVLAARKTNVELLLANHEMTCTTCERNLNCELQ